MRLVTVILFVLALVVVCIITVLIRLGQVHRHYRNVSERGKTLD